MRSGRNWPASTATRPATSCATIAHGPDRAVGERKQDQAGAALEIARLFGKGSTSSAEPAHIRTVAAPGEGSPTDTPLPGASVDTAQVLGLAEVDDADRHITADWGRYGELFDFDANIGQLTLDHQHSWDVG